MDPRLLRHYNRELQHLREMGAEFALQFPRIAGRLGMNGVEVADPYVERLLEGVSFLAARVQLKLEAEFPQFTQALLEMVYPHYLAPTPSMLVAQLKPDSSSPNLARGATVARGSALHGRVSGHDTTECEFRTAHDVTLWPITLTTASYFSFAPDLPLHDLPIRGRIKGGLRLRLKAEAGATFDQLGIDHLPLFFAGRTDVANRLHELCASSAVGVMVVTPDRSCRPACVSGDALRPLGFDDEDALLPTTRRGFQGYRLLQEYFSFAERYRFVDVCNLAPVLHDVGADEVEVVILLGRGDPTLERVVDAESIRLFCTPAINLFPRRTDRIHLNDESFEYHLVVDRTRPLDFEVYDVASVVGHGTGTDHEQQFRPFYAASSSDAEGDEAAYFTMRREPRLVGGNEARRGSRSGYAGSEVFLALVDPAQAPFSGELRQLAVQARCTNRDLPLQMLLGVGGSDLSLDAAAPVSGVRVVAGPSRPYSPLAAGAVAWRAINALSLNYLSLLDAPDGEGAVALRDLLNVYAPPGDAAARRQIQGVRSVSMKRVVRRLPTVSGPLAFGRGLEIDVTLEELAFEGASPYLLGAVLSHFFGRHVSINSFTETVAHSDSRGEIGRWLPAWGLRATL